MPNSNAIRSTQPNDPKKRVSEDKRVGMWHAPATIARNKFKYKSLSNWAFNPAVGCSHACRFCYVPSASTKKQGPKLARYGVQDPDLEWGEYVLLRPWDETKFLKSLGKAEKTRSKTLPADGNRAIIYCSTTDPYQVIVHPDATIGQILRKRARELVQLSLELILKESSLNVRILTRSPLAREDFGLFKKFGKRLVFGMSLPTLRDDLSKIYEPSAPAPSQRLKTLKLAKAAGLHVYVAMAPTYPECDEADLRATMKEIKKLDPITVFHEPINIRSANVERIRKHGESLGVKTNTAVFETGSSWRTYAISQLNTVEQLAKEVGLEKCLHLWPDKRLKSPGPFKKLQEQLYRAAHPGEYEGAEAKRARRAKHEALYNDQYVPWLDKWWKRVSEWPANEISQ